MKKKRHIWLKILLVLLIIGMVRGALGRNSTRSYPTRTTQPTTQDTQVAVPAAGKTAVPEAVVGRDFKKAMDAYEAFFDEYCTFMKKYAENPTDMNLLLQYTAYLTKYAEYMDALDKAGEEPMNEAEEAYFLEVTLRIEKKLLEAEGALLTTVK